MNLDIHRHLFPAALLAEARKSGNRFGVELIGDRLSFASGTAVRLTGRMVDEDVLIHELDAHRVDVVALSLMPPAFLYDLPTGAARDLSRLVNTGLFELSQRHKGRIVPLVHVPLQDVDASISEVTRPGVAGVQIGTHVNGTDLDDPSLLPFFEAAEANNVLVFIHPTVADVLGAQRLQRYHLRNLIGNVTETARALAGLMFGGVLDAFPELKICLAHGGGSAPYILGRWAHGQRVRQDVRARTSTPVQQLLKGLYFDSLTHDVESLRFLVELVGPERVMLGTDGQADMGDPRAVQHVEALGLAASDCRKILWDNAAGLLRL